MRSCKRCHYYNKWTLDIYNLKIITSYLAPWGFKGWFEHSITSHASYYTGCRETAQLLFRVRVVNVLVAYLVCTLPSFRQVSSSNTLPCRKSHFLYWRHHTNSAININGAAPYKALHWSWFCSRLDAWGPGHATLPTCREKKPGSVRVQLSVLCALITWQEGKKSPVDVIWRAFQTLPLHCILLNNAGRYCLLWSKELWLGSTEFIANIAVSEGTLIAIHQTGITSTHTHTVLCSH